MRLRITVGSEFRKKHMKIAACESPFERLRGSLISALEGHQRPPECSKAVEIHWREQLTLNDGEVDLDLVEPTGVDRGVDQDDVGPPGLEARGGPRATMGRAIVGDEIHAMRGTIGFRGHDPRDKTLKRGDAGLAFATPEQPGAMHVQGGQVCQRTGTRIFMFDTERTPGGGRQ